MDIEIEVRPKTIYVAQDGGWPRWQLILGFANQSAVEWTLEECTVRPDPPGAGADPAGRSALVGDNLRGSRTVAPGTTRRLLVQEAPGAGEVGSRLLLSSRFVNGQGARWEDSFAVPLVPRQTLALDFPLDGRWVAGGARADVHGLGMTFAFDFVVEADMALVEETRLMQPHEFGTFGRPLYAPMAGRVLAAVSDQPDLAVSPAGPSTFAQQVAGGNPGAAVVGNHVLIQGADESCVLLAHMKRGSVRVKAGDSVIAGQPIGQVGNSGNSTGAHLHIEVLDGVPDLSDPLGVSLTRSGVPFGFVHARGASGGGSATDILVPGRDEVVERVGTRP